MIQTILSLPHPTTKKVFMQTLDPIVYINDIFTSHSKIKGAVSKGRQVKNVGFLYGIKFQPVLPGNGFTWDGTPVINYEKIIPKSADIDPTKTTHKRNKNRIQSRIQEVATPSNTKADILFVHYENPIKPEKPEPKGKKKPNNSNNNNNNNTNMMINNNNNTNNNNNNNNDDDDDADEDDKKAKEKEKKDVESNSNSLIAQITYCKKIFLLTGDATVQTFERAKTTFPNKVFCFQVPHHGADGNMPKNFFNIESRNRQCLNEKEKFYFDTELLIISSHVNSDYRHPKPIVIDTCLEYLANKVKTDQRQPWHLIPFIREQYLHELPKNVSSWHGWHHVIPLAMGKDKNNKLQKTTYLTDLGLYSTTWGRSYCITLSKMTSSYKLDYFSLENTPDRVMRDYYLQEMGGTLNSFVRAIFYDLPNYLPLTCTWTGICLPNDTAKELFLSRKYSKLYLADIEFIDFRLCSNPLKYLAKCLVYLNKLISVLISDQIMDSMKPKFKELLLDKFLGKTITSQEVEDALGLMTQLSYFHPDQTHFDPTPKNRYNHKRTKMV